MFTGLDQSEHGCHETKLIKSLDIERIRLKSAQSGAIKEIGYSTYGISANPYIHPVYGFNGFDKYIAESYFTDIFGSVIEISNSLKPRVSKYRNTLRQRHTEALAKHMQEKIQNCSSTSH